MWRDEGLAERSEKLREGDPNLKDVSFVMANGLQITRSVGFAIIRFGQVFYD